MNRFQRAAAAMAVTAVVVAGSPAAFASGDEADRRALQRRLDEVVAAGAVGALAEVRDEHGVWRSTSGAAELDRRRDVPVRGRFRIGSITKTFVAVVALQLVEEGELRLDDTVERWLPWVVPGGHRITVRHLLDHTSGLYDFQDTLPMPPSPEFLELRRRTWTAGEQVRRAVANPPTSEPPGSAYGYSNTGYLLLGGIVEQVTGRTYAEEIERRIIRPLGLRATSLPGSSTRIRGPHPHGYVPVERGGATRLVDFTRMNPTLFGAGGEMISSTRDLNRFVDALLGGRLLPDHLLDQMKRPRVEGSRYGLGLVRHDTGCGVRVYGNDGDAVAYQSWSYATTDGRRQATVALTPDFQGDADDAVDAFLDEVFCP